MENLAPVRCAPWSKSMGEGRLVHQLGGSILSTQGAELADSGAQAGNRSCAKIGSAQASHDAARVRSLREPFITRPFEVRLAVGNSPKMLRHGGRPHCGAVTTTGLEGESGSVLDFALRVQLSIGDFAECARVGHGRIRVGELRGVGDVEGIAVEFENIAF